MERTTAKSQYDSIAEIIECIVRNKLEHMPLEELGKRLGLSRGCIQKVFSAWVGISPKQFGRYLSLQYAKDLLRQDQTTLKTALRSGLSGQGRLHDLFIDIEAMTPGEYQSLGKGLIISYSFFETRFGECLVASTDKGVCNIFFFGKKDKAAAVSDLKKRWVKAVVIKKQMPMHIEIEKYFESIDCNAKSKTKNKASSIKLHLKGTNFQVKVWEALLTIPEGSISTYGDIARKIISKSGGRDRGGPAIGHLARAVGMAIGDNPISYIIPCHRVLKSTGAISGYRWGVERKRAMLGFEAIKKNEK